MGKDRKARELGRVTVMALANLIATLVDTMRQADLPNDVVHQFLDSLERLNGMTLSGEPAIVMGDVVEIVRRSVPMND